jgi:hypothetical protein
MTPQELTTRKPQAVSAPIDGHTREYWTNELEVPYDQVLDRAAQAGFIDAWLQKKNGRQIDVLRWALGVNGDPGKLKQKKQSVEPNKDELFPYVLVQEFAKAKSKLAISELAKKELPSTIVDLCALDNEAEDYDSLALCMAFYRHDPQLLRSILHIDRVHKTGFARMKMKGGPRKPTKQLSDFLTTNSIVDILARFDKLKADGRTSEFKNILIDEDNHFVFVRRCERPSLIMQGREILHGYRPEWIVLVFFNGAKRVNISSLSVEDSLEIANRIATAYYGTPCEYENDSLITYSKQLDRLFEQLKGDAEKKLTLIELIANNSPLANSCGLKLYHSDSSSIGPSVRHFESKVGKLTASLDAIDSVKVLYGKKRVSLIFEKVDGRDDEFVVRYSDHRLNPLERIAFERYMADTHAIQILSTEKRISNHRQSRWYEEGP